MRVGSNPIGSIWFCWSSNHKHFETAQEVMNSNSSKTPTLSGLLLTGRSLMDRTLKWYHVCDTNSNVCESPGKRVVWVRIPPSRVGLRANVGNPVRRLFTNVSGQLFPMCSLSVYFKPTIALSPKGKARVFDACSDGSSPSRAVSKKLKRGE